jgi:hypothetical protein
VFTCYSCIGNHTTRHLAMWMFQSAMFHIANVLVTKQEMCSNGKFRSISMYVHVRNINSAIVKREGNTKYRKMFSVFAQSSGMYQNCLKKEV